MNNDGLLKNKLHFLYFIHNMDNNDFQKLTVLIKLIKKQYSGLRVAIKSPNPSNDRRWGDFFFASSLKKSLEKKGFNVVIQERENWEDNPNIDIVIVLRGRQEYATKPQHLNLMWNISHPDDVPLEEYNNYDIAFIASDKYADFLNNKVNTFVHPLLQCTDLENFYPQKNGELNEDILFVGVTRGVFRKIIQDILKTNHDFSIYGNGWDKFLDQRYIKGKFIENTVLNQYYSNCKILLNDHWEDMVEQDFVSNRIFDALACKTFVISDDVESIQSLFEGNVVTYTDCIDLNEKLNYYLTHEDERIHLANKGYEIVIKNHTFENRVSEMLLVIEKSFFPKFISQFDKISVDNINSRIIQEEEQSSNLIKKYIDSDYDRVVDENKSMTIKISRLQERIHLLEQRKR